MPSYSSSFFVNFSFKDMPSSIWGKVLFNIIPFAIADIMNPNLGETTTKPFSFIQIKSCRPAHAYEKHSPTTASTYPSTTPSSKQPDH